MVFGMGYTPGMVRNSETRVEDPADKVIDEFGV